jgi:hypothetical protein
MNLLLLVNMKASRGLKPAAYGPQLLLTTIPIRRLR